VAATGRTFTVETVGGARPTPDAPWRGLPDNGNG
jgi:hypothetical protein